MNRRILILTGLYIAAILLFAYLRPEKMDWSPSFSPDRKIPFAARVLYQELEFKLAESLMKSSRPVYNTTRDDQSQDSIIYFFLNTQFELSALDLEALLDFVSKGNTAFIASDEISASLLDTLRIRPEYEFVGSTNALEWFYEDNIALTLAQDDNVSWPAAVSTGYRWLVLEDSTHTILGHVDRQHPVFIRCVFGQGYIFLHTFPYAFSNYHMLYKDNHQYVSKVLAETGPWTTWLWDTYYLGSEGSRAQSPLAALNRYQSFRWAYWIGILTALIFILFTARRRQRIIPVLAPKRNSTLDFVHTIGDLYYHRADHADLIHKKITLLQAEIQKRYRLSVQDFTEQDAREVAARSGALTEKVSLFFAFVRKLMIHPETHRDAVFRLQKALDQFFERSRKS